MTSPEPPEDTEPPMPECQAEGTCCASCYSELGTCCRHDELPPLWTLETS